MLHTLKFVQGAVAKKDFTPALTHFRISGGRILGFNGTLALSSPIELDIEAYPKAIPFIKAIQTCRETVELNLTGTGRLAIRSGNFKCFVECMDEGDFPDVEPEGEEVEVGQDFLDVLSTLAPFIAEDASRPWARGILFHDHSAFATNNILLVQKWLGTPFPASLNIPKEAVAELLRLKETPTKIQMGSGNVTFHFEGDRWLRSQTYSLDWPDVRPILDREAGDPKPLPDGFFDAVRDLSPFVDDVGGIYFLGGKMSTSRDASSGATIAVPGAPEEGCFHYSQLALLEGVAKVVDFTQYPAPCPFFGDNLRGVIVGMRT